MILKETEREKKEDNFPSAWSSIPIWKWQDKTVYKGNCVAVWELEPEKGYILTVTSYYTVPVSVYLACTLWTAPSDKTNLIKIEQTNSLEDKS